MKKPTQPYNLQQRESLPFAELVVIMWTDNVIKLIKAKIRVKQVGGSGRKLVEGEI